MDGHDWSNQYEEAIRRLEKYLAREADGTFILSVTDWRDSGVNDPVVFADLKRSLDETNRKIRRGEIDPDTITIHA